MRYKTTRNGFIAIMAAVFAINAMAEPAPVEELREEFLSWKFGMFIHFNMATFHNVGWANGHEDPKTFSPDKLDCNQWAKAANAAGMKYAVLTVKHTGGWCLWDSAQTPHDITAFTNYKNGKGDIVREFVDSCRKHGLKVGFYYCFPGDYSRGKVPKGKENLRGMPPEAKGDYPGFVTKQLTELLTNYGPIDLLWCDQYQKPEVRGHWQQIRQHVKSLQPHCLIIANNSHDFKCTDIHSYEYPWLVKKGSKRALPPVNNPHPAEVCDYLGPRWFWDVDEILETLKSAKDTVELLKLCNSRNANYLLNVAPDRTGLLPDYYIKRLHEIGDLLAKNDPLEPVAE